MLSDTQIRKLLADDPSIVSPLPGIYSRLPADDEEWESYNSPIQPSSIDLHAGKIFIPGRTDGKEGTQGNGADGYTIKQGESVIVSTYEKLNLPDNIAGIVFPPSGKLSSKAILVSNLGHIDPGFKGHLRFTLINMGRESFTICREKDIVGTLLLFKTAKVSRGWLEMACKAGKADAAGGKSEPDQKEIDWLASDFVGIDQRMRKIADERITGLKYLNWNAVYPLLVTLFITTVLYCASDFFGKLGRLETQNTEFQKELLDQREKILSLEEKLLQVGSGKYKR